ncbi:RNA-directed DNA polymerase [Stakelama sp. CBK3Z-3]|uniref:RNA-directed DNA polymerase n=1 Tax=Stakelama flava TaxID=2860338 RepID=A0ABS6XIL1_9SPHN|nr:RNA-directed DNA polymerase [Stakelama flava]MBW4330037.1 RNA-directed DNA polymerase [Stakelama flava]
MSTAAIKKRAAEMRLRKLLRRGYLPAELPPPFTSDDFAASAVSFAGKWDAVQIRKYWTAPEAYSIPRYGDARRKLALVNPVNQLYVSHIIAENWRDIRARVARSKTSEFKPEFSTHSGGRAITGVDFDGVARRRARLLSTFGRYVKTDITRFYPSIYTHSIAWAILGKAHVKTNHHSMAFKSHFANHLDKAVGAGQEGQTIGIPIGPDTSRIIAELIAVEVEEIAKLHIPDFENRAVRYVDDMLIGLDEHETSAAVLSGLSLALYEYQLELNADKTGTFGLGCPHTPEWIHFVRTFSLTTRASQQRDDLDSFFEHAIFLADQNKRENALLFAVKRAASFNLQSQNTEHLVRWMLYCARRSATCLSFVAEHLAAVHGSTPLPDAEIHAYILQQIPIKAAAGHTNELAWLLFWAREISLTVPASAMTHVMALRSSVVGMLTLDLWHKSLISGALDFSFWQGFANEAGLKSEMWLIAYEATRKGWWPKSQNTDFITTHQFFADLWNANVEFYDPSKKARKRVTPSVLAASFDQGQSLGSSEYPF